MTEARGVRGGQSHTAAVLSAAVEEVMHRIPQDRGLFPPSIRSSRGEARWEFSSRVVADSSGRQTRRANGGGGGCEKASEVWWTGRERVVTGTRFQMASVTN